MARAYRIITIVEPQGTVIFGSTALLTVVGATASTHDREEGWGNFLFVKTEYVLTYNLKNGSVL